MLLFATFLWVVNGGSLKVGWTPNMTSPQYLRFKNWADNANSQTYAFDAAYPAILHQWTNSANYCTQAIQMTDRMVISEQALISSNTNPAISGDSYLESGPTLWALSLTYSECSGMLNNTQKSMWSTYANQTLGNIWSPNSARWGGRLATWSGWSIDNPGNNYFYSFTLATMSWALAADDVNWQNDLTNRIFPMLTAYFNNPPDGGSPGFGGGSREGTGYGTSHMTLFSIYQIWKASKGVDLCALSPHCIDSIDYWIHATVPSLNYLVPFGDQARDSTAAIFDYQRAIMLRLQNLNAGTPAAARARWWLESISVPQMGQGFEFWIDTIPINAPQPVAPTALVYFSNFTGALFARTAWGKDQTMLAFMAGPYTESHAAQEQGGFSIWGNGSWRAVTQNYNTHSGIDQTVDTHNALRFEVAPGNVIQQRNSPNSLMSYTQDATTLTATGNLTSVFPTASTVKSWLRTVTLNFATGDVETLDTFSVSAPTTKAFWQCNVPIRPVWNGQQIGVGLLRIEPQFTLQSPPTILDWSTIDSSEHPRGFRVSFECASGCRVKLLNSGTTLPPTVAASSAMRHDSIFLLFVMFLVNVLYSC